MAFRGNESPMDFQWEKHGPTDPSSPFHKFAMANDKKRKQHQTDPKSIFANLNLTLNEGSHSNFNSPAKGNFPSLREPNGQPYYLNAQAKDAPTSPWRNPSFTTPRKNYDIDFSSGPESSPVGQPDEETPDGKPLPKVPNDKNKEKSKSKRNSLFNFYGRFAPSSGKGELKKPVSDAVTKRVYKKRRQAQTFERQLALARRESEDNSDSDGNDPETPKRKQKKSKDLPPLPQKEAGMMAKFFNFIHAYPDAPSIIAKYFQVIFNGAILSGVLFLFYSFYATIRADVDKASEDAFQEAQAETMACQKHYIDNRCNAASRLPALEVSCARWEICMNRDPNAVRRASLSAHTFAEIFNSFVEPISLKTMVFTIVIVGLLLLVNNATFTLYRRSQEHNQNPDGYRAGSAQYGPGIHPGAQIAQMGQFAMSPGLPYQTPQQWQIQGQGSAGQIGYDQSPSKKRGGGSRSPEKKRLMLEHGRE